MPHSESSAVTSERKRIERGRAQMTSSTTHYFSKEREFERGVRLRVIQRLRGEHNVT